ncbi:MAG: nicotinate (nicotinamide) nucleotide adenylyltransferase [Oscillospiraceae bacterium]|nr:nicotinate (nicotinamide) nucleotide adenylyltransferase [Oscillospiraceae bacterium]
MTVLFGGTFDPVHNGHVSAVRKIIDVLCPDRMIIMPARINPFKTGSVQCATALQRLEMCRLAFEGSGEVSDLEIHREGVSYTIDTLEALMACAPDEYYLAVGSDSLRSLPAWHRAEDIVRIANVVTVSRRCGEDLLPYARAIEDMGGKVTLITADPFEVSSTQLRWMLSNNEDAAGLIPDKVYDYIKKNRIYQ